MPKPLRAILPLGLALCLSTLNVSGASPIPAVPQFLVLDEPGLLSASQLKALETLLIEHNQATGEQLMLGVFKDLGDENADRRTHEIFEEWLTKSGLSSKGALLAVFAQQKKGHLESGYGLPALDETSNHAVTHDFLEPELREGHIFRAVGLGILELLRIDGSPLIESGRAAGLLREGGLDGSFQPTQGAAFGFTGWLIFALLSLLVLLLVINNLLAAEAHFTGEGWYRPNPWKLLTPDAIKEMLARRSKQELKKGASGGLPGDW